MTSAITLAAICKRPKIDNALFCSGPVNNINLSACNVLAGGQSGQLPLEVASPLHYRNDNPYCPHTARCVCIILSRMLIGSLYIGANACL
jgi:hypothetical protein